MGPSRTRQTKGQDVYAKIHEATLGQQVHLLPQRQGQPVMIEGLPDLARGEFGLLAQPVDAPVAAVLGFVLQHLQEGGQEVAVAGVGIAGYRQRLHGGRLELMAQVPDVLLRDTGVRHRPKPVAAGSAVSRPP